MSELEMMSTQPKRKGCKGDDLRRGDSIVASDVFMDVYTELPNIRNWQGRVEDVADNVTSHTSVNTARLMTSKWLKRTC